MLRPACLLFFLWIASTTWASSPPDSLRRALQNAVTDEERLKITTLLSDKLYNTDPLQALEYADESIQLAKKLNSDSSLASAYSSQAKTFLHLGNYSRALEIYQSVIQLAEKMGDRYWQAVAYGNTRAASPSVLAPLRVGLAGAPGSLCRLPLHRPAQDNRQTACRSLLRSSPAG